MRAFPSVMSLPPGIARLRRRVVVALEWLLLLGLAQSPKRLLLGRTLLDETLLGQTEQPLLVLSPASALLRSPLP
jgi:hypothetical protein